MAQRTQQDSLPEEKVLNQTSSAKMEAVPSSRAKMSILDRQTIYLAIKCG